VEQSGKRLFTDTKSGTRWEVFIYRHKKWNMVGSVYLQTQKVEQGGKRLFTDTKYVIRWD